MRQILCAYSREMHMCPKTHGCPFQEPSGGSREYSDQEALNNRQVLILYS